MLVAGLDKYPDDSRLELPVILALGKTKSDDAVPILEERFAGNEDTVGWRARGSLALIGSPAARDALARVRAWYDLVELGDPRGLDIALDAVAHDEFQAADMLRAHPDPRFIPVLLAAVPRATHPRAEVVIAAALHACGAPEGRRLLEAIASDPRHSKSLEAALILERDKPS